MNAHTGTNIAHALLSKPLVDTKAQATVGQFIDWARPQYRGVGFCFIDLGILNEQTTLKLAESLLLRRLKVERNKLVKDHWSQDAGRPSRIIRVLDLIDQFSGAK